MAPLVLRLPPLMIARPTTSHQGRGLPFRRAVPYGLQSRALQMPLRALKACPYVAVAPN
jgi:hypothetical protein